MSPIIWTHAGYEISTLWAKLTSQMQNKLQTWYWSIMPQAEQSRSAIFESKPVDLKEWETTLRVILLLLICLVTLTKCVSWNEPCNINTGNEKWGPTKTDRKGEMTIKRVTVLRKSRWEGRSFKGALILSPPFI